MLLGGSWMRTLVRQFGSVARRHHQQQQQSQELLLIANPAVATPAQRYNAVRNFSITTAYLKKQMPPRPKVSEDEIEESFLKGSGPGGQKSNKTNSAVQLRHIPTGMVVKSQASRSRESNRKTARLLLAEKLEEIEKGPDSRRQIMGAIKQKQIASKKKKARRKYRKLDEEKRLNSNGLIDEDGADNCEDEGEDASDNDLHGTLGPSKPASR